MILKSLEIFGFKSFPKKVRIDFHPGITAIVGPNGCGKSNIVDAARWVLGEGPVSLLRCGVLEDLIFHGTERRNRGGIAEVRMTIENNGDLPLDFQEIEILRRVTRASESEYFINRKTARQRDVVDLFQDTGIYGYSIIERERINEILTGDSKVRRKLIEEAAGIGGYREHKARTLGRLERIQGTINRVSDVIHELEIREDDLSRQARRAKRYLVLKERIKKIRYAIYLKGKKVLKEKEIYLSKLKLSKQRYEKQLAELQTRYKKMSTGSTQLESHRKLREEIQEKDKKIAVLKERERSLMEWKREIERRTRIFRAELTQLQLPHPKLFELLKIPKEFEEIIRTALFGILDAWVVPEVKDALEVLKDHQSKVLAKSLLKPGEKIQGNNGVIGPLSNFITPKRGHKEIDSLLSNYVLVKDIQIGLKLRDRYPYFFFITSEGLLLTPQGIIHNIRVMFTSESASGREEIETKRKEVAEEVERKEEIEGKINKVREERKEVLLKLTELKREFQKLEREMLKESDISRSVEERIKNLIHSVGALRNDIENINLEIVALRSRANSLQHEEMEPADTQASMEGFEEEDLIRLEEKFRNFGPVNLLAPKEYAELEERLGLLRKELQDLTESKDMVYQTIQTLDRIAVRRFKKTLGNVETEFRNCFQKLFDGGEARLVLRDGNLLQSEIDILASPKGKQLKRIELLSTGEKALTVFALLFGIYNLKPSPFMILDEVDAPLDDANVARFVKLLKERSRKSQFILITHNKKTVEIADFLYGVTMEEPGVSKLVSVKLN